MTITPILALSDFTVLFPLKPDASGFAMGVVLLQHQHPNSFFSKPLCLKLQLASTYMHELHAITSVVHKWHHYLLGHHFDIIIHHKSLKELMSHVIQTPKQQVYLSKLLGYDYSI